MFCKKCYADLSAADDGRCPKCRLAFDRERPRTFLARPFPGWFDVIGAFVLTTIVAAVVAFAVSLHQLARTSSH